MAVNLTQPKQLIYDIGMNNGDDSDYYLRKGFRVVAIEANPALCELAKKRFPQETSSGDLIIENVGVADKDGFLDFYLNTRDHVMSTFVPQANETQIYEILSIKTERLSTIIARYGKAYYIKIDIEGFDFLVLKDLFISNIVPPYISAEAHTIDVLCMLLCMGYNQLKVIRGSRVSADFGSHPIKLLNGSQATYSFKHNSSGPFGDDLPGRWMTKEETLLALLTHEDTWRDVHAKSTRAAYIWDAENSESSEMLLHEIKLAYDYWQRYPDVAKHLRYGEHGILGVSGARQHYDEYGISEGRKWGL